MCVWASNYGYCALLYIRHCMSIYTLFILLYMGFFMLTGGCGSGSRAGRPVIIRSLYILPKYCCGYWTLICPRLINWSVRVCVNVRWKSLNIDKSTLWMRSNRADGRYITYMLPYFWRSHFWQGLLPLDWCCWAGWRRGWGWWRCCGWRPYGREPWTYKTKCKRERKQNVFI